MSSTRRRLTKLAQEYGVKSASVAEYSVLFDKIADGDLGDNTREALKGICEAIDQTISSDNLSEKTASVYDGGDYAESDVRKDRLDQLLRR